MYNRLISKAGACLTRGQSQLHESSGEMRGSSPPLEHKAGSQDAETTGISSLAAWG